MSRPRLIALLLALVTLVVYLPVTHHEFLHYDDDDYVVSNPMVQSGLTWAGIKWAFTSFHAANWHPLTWISHMADCEWFKLNPGAHHFISVLIHAANAGLLCILFWRLTNKLGPSALVAALFAWHPTHVESVAWVAERKDVLSTFFGLLALLAYVRYAQGGAGRRAFFYAAALGCFALGLMAKPMLVTLPFVLLLVDLWPLGRIASARLPIANLRPLLIEKIPFFALTVLACVITCLAQRHAIHSLEMVPLDFRLKNAVVAVAGYLGKLFWPAQLAIFYPLLPVAGTTVALAAMLLGAFTAAAWGVSRRHPCWLVGWLWFLGTLVPVLGLVQVGGAAMADRYTYIPSIGLFAAVVFGLQDMLAARPGGGKIAMLLAVLLPVLCLAGTARQLRYWQDNGTVFRHALDVTPDNDTAHDNLGVMLEQQGRASEAIAEYRAALRLNPSHYQLHFAIGNLLEKLHQPDAALAEYRLCLARDPQVPALHGAAGCVLLTLGNEAEALKEFAAAAQLDAHYALPRIETAKILFRQGRDQAGLTELRAAIQAAPDDFQTLATAAHYLAASDNPALRNGPAALALALKANDLAEGAQPMVQDILGMAYAATGNFTNAASCAQNALDLSVAAGFESTNAFHQRLELYKNHQPWLESFRSTNAPVATQP